MITDIKAYNRWFDENMKRTEKEDPMAKNTKQRNYTKVTHDLEAWWNPEKGMVLEGVLAEFKDIETKFGEKILYFIHTTEPCMARSDADKGEDTEPEEWPAGTIVGMLSSGGLAAMRKIRIGTQVRIECTGAKDIGRGNDMRTFSILVDNDEIGKGKSHHMVEAESRQEQLKSDDIPF